MGPLIYRRVPARQASHRRSPQTPYSRQPTTPLSSSSTRALSVPPPFAIDVFIDVACFIKGREYTDLHEVRSAGAGETAAARRGDTPYTVATARFERGISNGGPDLQEPSPTSKLSTVGKSCLPSQPPTAYTRPWAAHAPRLARGCLRDGSERQPSADCTSHDSTVSRTISPSQPTKAHPT